MYKNYIFDLYGTLVDINTDEGSREFWYKLSLFFSFKGATYDPQELQDLYENLVKAEKQKIKDTNYQDFPIEIVFKKLYQNKDISASDQLITDTAHFFRINSIKYLKLYDGARELLELLKAKGKKIYLLSNAQKVFTLYEMKALDIEKYFDDIFISSDYNVCKPDSKFFNALIQKHNLNINESIMIGNDYLCDINGAVDAGLDSLYIDSNLSPKIIGKLNSKYSVSYIFEAAKLIVK